MKLHNIKPLFEDLEADPFSDRSLTSAEHLNWMQKQLKATNHLRSTINTTIKRLLKSMNAINKWSYPGGWDARDADKQAGKVVEIGSNIVPNTPENQQGIKRIINLNDRVNHLADVIIKLPDRIDRAEKSEARRHLTAKQKGSTDAQIPRDQIPDKISIGGRDFNNAYFQGSDSKYAGDPAFYKWTPKRLMVFYKLDKLLTSNGYNGFTKIYASRDWRGHFYLNVLGADGQFLWKIYDASKKSGPGDVYTNTGTSHSVDVLFSLEPMQLKRFLSCMKKKTP